MSLKESKQYIRDRGKGVIKGRKGTPPAPPKTLKTRPWGKKRMMMNVGKKWSWGMFRRAIVEKRIYRM